MNVELTNKHLSSLIRTLEFFQYSIFENDMKLKIRAQYLNLLYEYFLIVLAHKFLPVVEDRLKYFYLLSNLSTNLNL